MCLSLSFDTGDLGSSGVGWANAIMLRSKKVPSRPRVPTKGLGISSGSAANSILKVRLNRSNSNRVAPSKAAADVSDWTIARRKGPQPARPYGTPYTRSALAPIVPNRGLLSMSRSDEYRRFAAECLKMAQTAEEEQNRATFLQMARVWFALAEREEARQGAFSQQSSLRR